MEEDLLGRKNDGDSLCVHTSVCKLRGYELGLVVEFKGRMAGNGAPSSPFSLIWAKWRSTEILIL